MVRNVKRSIIALCIFAITFLSLGIISIIPTKAATTMSVQDAISEFVMENGASVRNKANSQGIRFNAVLSKQAYTVLQSAKAKFGMLIVPKDYVAEGYDLTVENVFGKNAVYVPNVKASDLEKIQPNKRAIIKIDTPFIDLVNGAYKIYGSIINVLDENVARGFIGRAYVYVNGAYHLAEYADGLVDNNTRSMAFVAKRAIDNGDENSAILQSAYVNKVKDKTFNYTVKETVIELDGSVTVETVRSGSAKFGTTIVQMANKTLGFESNSVNSFVGMEDAEFNVVYKAMPVNVVVDSDATATELYAANELANYIEQVTGKAVKVGVKTQDHNNIYISTTPSLGLAPDSFKLSTDAKGNVHINGVDERGTLYGVYEFEEQNLGIKFLTEEYTYVPVTNKQISTLGDSQKRTYEPAFEYRTYMNNSIGLDGDDNVKYSSHLRFIAQFSQEKAPTKVMSDVQYFMPWMAKPWLTASHSLLTYAAVGAWKKGLTELVDVTTDSKGYITSIKFKSSAPSHSTYGSAIDDTIAHMLDVCYTNAYAKEWVTEGLKYMIDTYGKDYEYFMLGQADKTTECDCSTCQKAIVSSINNWWNPKKNKADLTATFIKDVITTVNGYGVSKCGEKYSDNKIVMFAYQKTEPAPKNEITGMPDNVYIQWAPIDQDRYFPLSNSNPNGWKNKTGIDKFMVWSYEVDFGHYFNYYPTMHTWIDNFQTYKDLGVEGVMMQSSWNTTGVADSYLEAYVASKLLWNFKEDSKEKMQEIINSAKDEFIQYFYGEPAKDLILKYYNDFDALYAKKFSSKGYKGTSWSFTQNDLQPLLDLINQAIAKTTSATHKSHLKMLSLTPRYMLVQYCGVKDDYLANDMGLYASLSGEGTTIDNDQYLKGGLNLSKGYTTVTEMEYDEKGRINHLTLEIPDNSEWSARSPYLTESFLNKLYDSGVTSITIQSSSTAKTGNFIYLYNGNANYFCPTTETIDIVKNGGVLRFSYVDVSGKVHSSGQTIGTTLDLRFSYYSESENIAETLGMTINNGTTIKKSATGYTLANVGVENNAGGFMSAYFSAEQVNQWIAQGYSYLSLNVSFNAGNNIDQVVGLNGEKLGEGNFTELFTNESGSATWKFTLTLNSPIQFWAQKSGSVNSGEFNISNVNLTHNDACSAGHAVITSEKCDANGRLTSITLQIPDGVDWWINPPTISQSYLNNLYAQGVRKIIIGYTANPDNQNLVVNYNGTDSYYNNTREISLIQNGGNLMFSYVDLNNGGKTVATTLTLTFSYSA